MLGQKATIYFFRTLKFLILYVHALVFVPQNVFLPSPEREKHPFLVPQNAFLLFAERGIVC